MIPFLFKGSTDAGRIDTKATIPMTGIPQRHIIEMETGKRQVGRKRAEILANALNVTDYRIFL
jgi:hypothetical protein